MNKSLTRIATGVLAATLAFTALYSAPVAAVKAGATCKTKGEIKKKGTLVCKKQSGKLVWVKVDPWKGLSGSIRVDGSSTVTPLIAITAEDFQKATKNKVRVTVATSGTGGGFEKFCKNETDISMASRPIKTSEADACAAAGVKYAKVTVANDGLAVVVNPSNTWATCLTTAELKKIWEPAAEDKVNNWKQVRSDFPSRGLVLYGPGADSGTFDYFTEAINGKAKVSRTDYQPSEDDNIIVNGIANTLGGLGYFGLSYVLENPTKVKALQIDSGNGCVAPTTATVQNGTYKPLGRELYIYVKQSSLKNNKALAKFIEYYLYNIKGIVKEALFVPLTAAQLKATKEEVERVKNLAD